jgi:hypothetical protein
VAWARGVVDEDRDGEAGGVLEAGSVRTQSVDSADDSEIVLMRVTDMTGVDAVDADSEGHRASPRPQGMVLRDSVVGRV